MRTTIIFAAFLLISFSSCNSNKSKPSEGVPAVSQPEVVVPTPVITQELEGFFVKNTFKQDDEFELEVYKNEAEFDEHFGMAKTMTNKIEKPDFATSIAIAVILRSTNIQTTIKMDKTEIEGENLNVYVDVEKGSKQSSNMVPAYLFIVEKDIPAKEVQLFVNGEKKEGEDLK